MRILFAGTPEMAVPSLEALNECFEVCGVLTNPDKAKGRGRKTVPSPVKVKADELGLPLLQPENIDQEVVDRVKAMKPDVLVCIAYGKLFRKAFLDIFPLGGVNLHPSMLPKYRGASPVSEAIKNGDSETAVTIQRLAMKMDSGDILFQKPYPLDRNVSTGSFLDLIARDGALYMVEVLTKLEKGELTGIPQDEEKATYCTKVSKEDGLIDWYSSADEIERLIRAYSPAPGGFTFWNEQILFVRKASTENLTWKIEGRPHPGQILGVDKSRGILVQTGDGLICLEELQLQSRKSLDFKSFLNGVKDFLDTTLGEVNG